MNKYLTSFLVIAVMGIGSFPMNSHARPKKTKDIKSFQESLKERKLYVGKDSTEAIMNFDHEVELDSSREPSIDDAKKQIDQQVVHLFGPMGSAEFTGVPKGNHEITNIKISSDRRSKDRYTVRYHYKGTTVIKNGPEDEYEVLLPNNPDKIYEQGLVDGEAPCTDSTHSQEEYFWYFWNPSKWRCPLQENEHYKRVTTSIERLENTTESYPEYDRLADEDGVISIHVFFGMDNPFAERNPQNSEDINAGNYREFKQSLLSQKLGFKSKKVWSRDDIYTVATSKPTNVPFVEELEKVTPKAKLLVRLFFGPTDSGYYSQAFYHFFDDALSNSSVMIYAGHSGLGKYLSLPGIKRASGLPLRPNANRYQIYYFNSCSSYPYYNEMFFNEKRSEEDSKGTKNLDIFTNGLSTFFHVLHDTDLAVVKAVNAWATGKGRVSYQGLAEDIDSGNLFGINGDEDNQ